jgi:hypothetical protein
MSDSFDYGEASEAYGLNGGEIAWYVVENYGREGKVRCERHT